MRRILFALAAAALLLPGGCGGSGESDDQLNVVIGVSVMTYGNPYFKELADAIEKEAARHNYQVIVVDGQEDPVLQDKQVDDFITKQVDAIILSPADCGAVGATIAKANRANIPVFTADLTSESEQGESD